MKSKKAQSIFGLSYGVIFSIIIIIFIIGVAFFVISHFLSLNKCTQVGFFYDSFQNEIEKAWRSGKYVDEFNATLPGGIFGTKITYVCFGELSMPSANTAEMNSIKQELNDYFLDAEGKNFFLYPPEQACDGDLSALEIKCNSGNSDCMTTDNRFFCVKVQKGAIAVSIKKDTTDTLVKVSES